VLSAEGAVFLELQTLSGVALVLRGVIVALLTLGTPQGDLNTVTGFRHIGTSFLFCRSKQKTPERLGRFRRSQGYKNPQKATGNRQYFASLRPAWAGKGFLWASRKNAHKKKALFTGAMSLS
jgi:hypothetical protein